MSPRILTYPQEFAYRSILGLVRVAALVPQVRPIDVTFNVDRMVELAHEARGKGVQVATFPELGITGYTCRDAFLQEALQQAAVEGLRTFAARTKTFQTTFIVSLPLVVDGRLFNVSAVVACGKVLGFVPKSYPPNYGPFEELRWFSPASHLTATEVTIPGLGTIPIGTDLLFDLVDEHGMLICAFGIEICEDGWHRMSPSGRLAANGAVIIFNQSASNFTVAKDEYRHMIFSALSGDIIGAYVYASCGHGESTTDVVFDGDAFIAENGGIVAQSNRWATKGQVVYYDIDVQSLLRERVATSSYGQVAAAYASPHRHVSVLTPQLRILSSAEPDSPFYIHRNLAKFPFVPSDRATLDKRCQDIVFGLRQAIMVRLELLSRARGGGPVHCYFGHSGGRDSTLVGEILIEAYKELDWPLNCVHSVRMPGPTSSDGTQELSLRRCGLAGFSVETVPIEELTLATLRNIGHEPHWHEEDMEARKCLTCQNAQARVRTLILMEKGFTVGTGDLTEGVLGWCTYNGDQMSMYGLLSGVPKTLVEHLIRWIATNLRQGEERQVLEEILAEIISPELVAVRPGEALQSTEDEVGPMPLNDFFIYWMLRHGASPSKIAFLASVAFKEVYDVPTILKWLTKFYQRFQAAQFKRSATPDAPLIGSVGISPRGNLRWPSDGSAQIFLNAVQLAVREFEANGKFRSWT